MRRSTGLGLAWLAACAFAAAWATAQDEREAADDSEAQAVTEDQEDGSDRPDWRDRRRGRRIEWVHDESGQHFLGPKAWKWHDGPNRSTIDKVCYPPTAKTYLPCAILRVKERDQGVTFPMVVDYAWFKLRKLVHARDDYEKPADDEMHGGFANAKEFGGKILKNQAIELPFENDGAHLIHVEGELEGLEVECYQIIFMKGDWWTIVAFGAREGTFDEHLVEFEEFIDGISFSEPEEN